MVPLLLALTAIPTGEAVDSNAVHYRIEYLSGDDSESGDPEYVVITPHNRVARPFFGSVVVPEFDGGTLFVRMTDRGWEEPVVDEFRFDRGRVRLDRACPHPER